jgi:hypothetical protein
MLTAPFTREEKRKAIKREIGQREHVYPRLVASGKITQEFADRQIAVMRAILADYEEPALL